MHLLLHCFLQSSSNQIPPNRPMDHLQDQRYQDYQVDNDIASDHVQVVVAQVVAHLWVLDVVCEEEKKLDGCEDDKLIENLDEVVYFVVHRQDGEVVGQEHQ